jgi:hypothetical protein
MAAATTLAVCNCGFGEGELIDGGLEQNTPRVSGRYDIKKDFGK